jgi:peptide methionine sulfoxide reductase msrA/msrB
MDDDTRRRSHIAAVAMGAAVLLAIACYGGAHAAKEPTTMLLRALTPEEERVIIDKGTEAPFTGALLNVHDAGVFRCKHCGAPLFPSSAKFDSRTGWPSFDDAFPGAVKLLRDADGDRTEIVCARCGGHLGHVFFGEHFTPKNARYCVNSISLEFEPASPTGAAAPGAGVKLAQAATGATPSPIATAYFAGGCFWGVEYYLKQQPGVLTAETGYMGGDMTSPAYHDVSSGRTGHAETVKVTYDPMQVSYETLAKLFFEIHDPTELNRQGPDVGTQYRSIVFYATPDQKRVAEKLIGLLKAKGYKVVTQVVPAGQFWKAEDYHQDYYFKNGEQPYCHFRVRRFD